MAGKPASSCGQPPIGRPARGGRGADTLVAMAQEIRVFGDPVLKTKATEVGDIDAKLVTLADHMIQVMYDAPGSRSPRRRSACRSSCSSTTSATGRTPS